MLLFFTFFLLVGCAGGNESNAEIAAEVGDEILLFSDVRKAIPSGLPKSDSLALSKRYINNWVVDKMLYQQAQDKLENTDRIEALVEEYQRSIYNAEFEKQYLDEHLSKEVSSATVDSYYVSHQSSLLLPSALVKGLVVTVPTMAPDIKALRKASRSLSMDELESLCVKNSAKLDYFPDDWRLVSDLCKQGFASLRSTGHYTKDQFIEYSDDQYVYFLKVVEAIPSSSVMPRDFADSYIRLCILQQRRQQQINTLHQQLLKKAIKQGYVNAGINKR